jgi:crotonobetainyl-CoA:carnitine CoA-transferase CaiB-like acyl-CoA transferase
MSRDASSGPLANLRIIELANVVAGPSVGTYLSDFGAGVIKIEQPADGDPARSLGEAVGEMSAWWLVLGRNKRSVTLDLKHARGREALLRLVERADVLVESFRPGVLERLDLSPDTLLARNGKLIVVRVSGFGQTGPRRDRPGFGTLAEAFSGHASLSGYADRPPLLAPIASADAVAGLFATWALLVALYARDTSGAPGQVIDVSLFEALFNTLGPLPTLFKHNGYVQTRNGSRLPFSSPRNVYETSDGEFFAVSASTPSAANAVMSLVDVALPQDPRFATLEARALHADELDEIVAAWIKERPADEIEIAFEQAGVAGARVLSIRDVFEDEHYRARQTLIEVPDSDLGSVTMQAPVPRMSATPATIRHVGRALGEDTDAVLAELGFSAEEIESYRREGAW